MRKKVKGRQSSIGDVVPEIRELISPRAPRTVLVPKPDKFYGQLWRAMLPALAREVREIEPNTFSLNPDFFERFVQNLYLVPISKRKIESKYYEPSDWVARALCGAATEVLEQSGAEDETVWPAGRPVSEAWEPLKHLPSALWPTETLYEYVEGQFKPLNHNQFEHPRIGITVELRPDPEKQALSELKISVRGKPIFDLIGPTQIAVEAPEWLSTVKEARVLWKSLLHLILVRLGIDRAERGRPGGDLGSRAAWLKDQLGMSWGQIGKRLNQPEDNCRKQAKQFWKRERAKYAAMIRTRSS